MDVPLAAERTVMDGRQYVTVWSKGEPKLEPAPFLPYCYARERFPDGPVRQTPVTVRPISTLRPESWHRVEFATVRDLSEIAHQRKAGEIAEANLPFVQRILLDQPDWFRRFPNGEPSRMVLDIEQRTMGRYDRGAPLISIAWAIDNGEPECVMGDGRGDADILEAFLGAVAKHDPDVLIGYNIKGYDLPTLLARLEANRMSPGPLVRPGGRLERGREGLDLVGRLVYDVYDSVKLDQTLYGIKDRKLKTVARWRGIPAIQEDMRDNAHLVGTERLALYNVSDVTATRLISQPYLANLVELASFYGAPLATILDATPNFHCTVLQGRINVKRGVVSDGTNNERFGALYAETGGDAFVGGIVALYQRGLFRPVTKVDFASMYPSILVALGAGSDNTRYEGTVPEGPFEARRSGETLELLVPDPARDTRHRITIEGRSELALQLADLLAFRMKLKEEYRAAESASERERTLARQGMVKVILNSVYGVMASRHARYGSLPVAMAIVGTARHLIRRVEDALGDQKIETDTDGVYASGEVDAEPINELVNAFVVDALGGEPILRVDAERFSAGWFHQGKNYVLLHEDGRLETHGVAFKGSSRAPLFDKALDEVARALLSGAADLQAVANQALDLDRYEPDDFVMRIKMGKNLGEYDSPNHIAAQVARAAQLRGQTVGSGDQILFVKVRGGYDLPSDAAFARVDKAYYAEVLTKMLARLGVEARPGAQRSLAEFL